MICFYSSRRTCRGPTSASGTWSVHVARRLTRLVILPQRPQLPHPAAPGNREPVGHATARSRLVEDDLAQVPVERLQLAALGAQLPP